MTDILDKLKALQNLCPTSDWTQINAAGKSAIGEAEREIESLRAQLASARKALERAEEWLSGWASAEPYISDIRAALKELSK